MRLYDVPRGYLIALGIAVACLQAGCGGGGGGDGGTELATSDAPSGGSAPPPATPPPTPPPPPAAPSKWSAPTLVSTAMMGLVESPARAAVDANANAFVVLDLVPLTTNVATVVGVRRTSGGPWGAGEPISDAVATGSTLAGYRNPRIGADDGGAAIAVWDYFNIFALTDRDFVYEVQASYAAAGAGWGVAQVLNADSAQTARNINAHVRRDGTAWAVWSERTFKHQFFASFDLWAIFAARFTPMSGWSAAEKVSADHANGFFISKIATSDAGDPMVLYERQGGGTVVYATVRNPAGTWNPAATVVDVGNNFGFPPEADLAVDASGNAIAVWRQHDSVRHAIVSRRYSPAGGWEPPLELTLPSNDNAFAPRVAMDAQGNAFVLWHEFDGSSYAIWAARFDRALGWVDVDVISSPAALFGDDSQFPQIAFDAAGNAVAVWTKYVFSINTTVVRANVYVAGTGWAGDETISTGRVARLARVAMSPSGGAVATWAEEDNDPVTPPFFQYWSSTYTP